MNDEKIYNTLRSLFRLKILVEDEAIEFIMNNEIKLFKARMNDLNEKEIIELFTIWPDYLAEQIKADEEDLPIITAAIDQRMSLLN